MYIKEDGKLNESHDLQMKADTVVLAKYISDSKFSYCVIVWYDLLSAINPISKQFKFENYNMLLAARSIAQVIDFLKKSP